VTATVLVHRDPQTLAAAVAARLVTRLVDVQAATGGASVVLTGGSVGIATLAALADMPARDAIDWRNLDIWWGDERFLPAGHPDRNETQARAALLDALPLDPARIHAMPASDGPDGDDPDAAAARYAAALAAAAKPGHATLPHFDVLMLGVGEDGHVASIFPEHPSSYEVDGTAMAVRNSPKPPPTRISLTLPTIRGAKEIWLVVAGEDKASAVHLALSGAGPVQVPAAGAVARSRTLWLLDRGAASKLPPAMARTASP